MIIYLCSDCHVELRREDDGEAEVRKSHGYCRKCFLKFVVSNRIATVEEKNEWEELLEHFR